MPTPLSALVATGALLVAGMASAESIGQFAAHQDVGAVNRTGAVSYDDKLQQYRISASGKNTWFADDQMHYTYNQMQGDFIVTARVAFEGKGADPHRKIGWDVRANLSNSAAHVVAAVHGGGLASLQFREKDGADTEEYRMGIVAPAWKGLVPYRDYLGSDIEIMDMDTHNRRIVLRSPDSLQAPNWTRDGRALIYNAMGLMHRFDIASGKTSVIKTGIVTTNNKDHVLSWSGMDFPHSGRHF